MLGTVRQGNTTAAEPTPRAGCVANITLKNVAFYGQGTPSQPSVCAGVTPASAAVTGNVVAVDNGTTVYGSARPGGVVRLFGSVLGTGDADTITFDNSAGSFSVERIRGAVYRRQLRIPGP